jgi:hypothetical protein
MSPQQQNRLTKIVKRFLDVIWGLNLAVAVIWPIAVLIIGLNIPSDPAERHTDVSAFLRFQVNAIEPSQQLAPAEEGVLLLKGSGEVLLNNTDSYKGWFISGAITQIMIFIFLFGLRITRRLFASLLDGDTFTAENADRMKMIGYTFVGWNVIAPIMQYLGSRSLLGDIVFTAPGIHLFPGFQINIGGLFAGLAIVVLSGVLREAVDMRYEQELTI